MVDGSCELIAKGWEEMTLTQPSPERGRGNIILFVCYPGRHSFLVSLALLSGHPLGFWNQLMADGYLSWIAEVVGLAGARPSNGEEECSDPGGKPFSRKS